MSQSAIPGSTTVNNVADVNSSATWLRWMAIVAIVGTLLLLGLYKLADWPLTWFDEGSHLHVPKTLLQHGVYADISSEGYRYFGPTIGVGPTVMLPIAGVFKLIGIGLWQARIVMVLYLLAACAAFWWLARVVSTPFTAWVATLLLIVTPVVALVENGRQVLGEVPGLFFVCAGLALWFARWERAKWYELVGAGALLGLGIVTKYQILIVLGGGLGLAWLLNFVTFRAPQRLFLIPGAVAVVIFTLWQGFSLVYLGPSTVGENLAAFRTAAAGAAAVFNPDLMVRSLRELVRPGAYFALLLPVLVYSGYKLLRNRPCAVFARSASQRQHLTIIYLVIVVNLLWYVVASVSWIRYAFLGAALSSIFVALTFAQATDNFNWKRVTSTPRSWVAVGTWALLVLMVVLPGVRLTWRIATAPPDDSRAMTAYMNANVPLDALVETWEPQMGFLTDHLYHYPPQSLLNRSVRQVWLGETPVNELYDFETEAPDYVLRGAFSSWVDIFPAQRLATGYQEIYTAGPYSLYERNRVE